MPAKITYKQLDPRHYAVFIEGKRVGTITELLSNEFQYFPQGEMQEGGEKFFTLSGCKQSLEGD